MENKESKKTIEKIKILAAGDIHGDSKSCQRLARKAEKENVDLVILTGDLIGLFETKEIIKPFLSKNKKVIFVPGNWESREDAEEISKKYNIKNIEDHYLIYKNTGIFGIGLADWKIGNQKEGVFEKLKRENEKLKNLEKRILVSHHHAAGTKSELSGFKGDLELRKAIDKLQPDLFISGHIHELEGVEEKIGKTRVINVGRKGKIIEL